METLTITENDPLFAVHCPVLVSIEDKDESEVEEKFISVKPVIIYGRKR